MSCPMLTHESTLDLLFSPGLGWDEKTSQLSFLFKLWIRSINKYNFGENGIESHLSEATWANFGQLL